MRSYTECQIYKRSPVNIADGIFDPSRREKYLEFIDRINVTALCSVLRGEGCVCVCRKVDPQIDDKQRHRTLVKDPRAIRFVSCNYIGHYIGHRRIVERMN